MEKAPYKLIIHTDSYTGNFERELVAFAFGVLDKEQSDYANSYKKAFWNSVAASDIDSLEEYAESEDSSDSISGMILEMKVMEDKLNEILSKHNIDADIPVVSADERKKKLEKEKYDSDIRRLYDNLCYTYQEVDDWEQDTFYNICSYYKNSEYNCDTIFVQLKNPLPEKFEKIVIERIKNYFNVFNIIEDYDWVCQFGSPRERKEKYKLLDLELVDENDNLIKKYL